MVYSTRLGRDRDPLDCVRSCHRGGHSIDGKSHGSHPCRPSVGFTENRDDSFAEGRMNKKGGHVRQHMFAKVLQVETPSDTDRDRYRDDNQPLQNLPGHWWSASTLIGSNRPPAFAVVDSSLLNAHKLHLFFPPHTSSFVCFSILIARTLVAQIRVRPSCETMAALNGVVTTVAVTTRLPVHFVCRTNARSNIEKRHSRGFSITNCTQVTRHNSSTDEARDRAAALGL